MGSVMMGRDARVTAPLTGTELGELAELRHVHGTIGNWAGVRWVETEAIGNRATRRAAAARSRRKDARTALCSNRGPTYGPIDIRMPAVARTGDEIDM